MVSKRWYQKASKHEGGVLGYMAEGVWNLIKKTWDFMKEVDWEKVWEKIKEFNWWVEVEDKLLTSLFGKYWTNTRDFLQNALQWMLDAYKVWSKKGFLSFVNFLRKGAEDAENKYITSELTTELEKVNEEIKQYQTPEQKDYHTKKRLAYLDYQKKYFNGNKQEKIQAKKKWKIWQKNNPKPQGLPELSIEEYETIKALDNRRISMDKYYAYKDILKNYTNEYNNIQEEDAYEVQNKIYTVKNSIIALERNIINNAKNDSYEETNIKYKQLNLLKQGLEILENKINNIKNISNTSSINTKNTLQKNQNVQNVQNNVNYSSLTMNNSEELKAMNTVLDYLQIV